MVPIRTSRSATTSNTEAIIDRHFTLNVNLQIARLPSSMTTLWESMTRNHFKKRIPNKNRPGKIHEFPGRPSWRFVFFEPRSFDKFTWGRVGSYGSRAGHGLRWAIRTKQGASCRKSPENQATDNHKTYRDWWHLRFSGFSFDMFHWQLALQV